MGVSLTPTCTAHTDDTGRLWEAFFLFLWGSEIKRPTLTSRKCLFFVKFLLCQERLVAFRETLTLNGEIEKKRQVEQVG